MDVIINKPTVQAGDILEIPHTHNSSRLRTVIVKVTDVIHARSIAYLPEGSSMWVSRVGAVYPLILPDVFEILDEGSHDDPRRLAIASEFLRELGNDLVSMANVLGDKANRIGV